MVDETEKTTKDGKYRSLIERGAEIAGGAIGGALGFLAAGPAGAAVLGAGGAAAAMALRHLGQEASERMLGPREQIRVGGLLAIAAEEIGSRISNGEKIRADGFFDSTSGRSDGEEVAESILLKSQREAEERKIPYMAHLLSSVAFDTSISAQMAHQLIRVAEQLTYRQLCLLRISVLKTNFSLHTGDYRGKGEFTKEVYQVLYECLDLYHKALINFGGEVLFGPTDVAPDKMTVQALGADLYNLMRLSTIPDSDILPVVIQLK